MQLSDFDYHLPPELIAQTPVEPRDSSRLMVVDGDDITHHRFSDVIRYFAAGDCLVLNDTQVIPARLFGKKETGGQVELLLVSKVDDGVGDSDRDGGSNCGDDRSDVWECMVRGKKIKKGSLITINDRLRARIVSDKPGFTKHVKFEYDGDFDSILEDAGIMPLPPYIKEKLPASKGGRYQTVYAKHRGSIAAPTAGLHFTPQLLSQIADMGVNIAHVTLHVGLGTFLPVREDDVTKHEMHTEEYCISEKAASIINESLDSGGRLFVAGTTSLRTLETVYRNHGKIIPTCGTSDLFIYPPYEFKTPVYAMITNFHLPASTLLMLICALGGMDTIFNAYEIATKDEYKYRFYSFGDAMLLLRNE
ncbi:MAG: tRNA preQ1(34) S-adenosylmethionine ribosyltransferase-isomerase QueA [Methanosarcinales archaeon]|nr:tRNA preQ1(34) S-adenosylmethionine ribosyltransferase-isomerase QueA [Methanosarcinales archaeon]